MWISLDNCLNWISSKLISRHCAECRPCLSSKFQTETRPALAKNIWRTILRRMALNLLQKLEILADAAKYDASCASSGGTKRNARSGGIGSVTGAGICHSFTP